MKFMVTGFLVLSSLAAFSSKLNLLNAAEFEFLHCEPTSTQVGKSVGHYIKF